VSDTGGRFADIEGVLWSAVVGEVSRGRHLIADSFTSSNRLAVGAEESR